MQVVAQKRLDAAPGQRLHGGDHVIAHHVLKGAAHRQHLQCMAALGERALGLGQAIAQYHDDRVGPDRRAGLRRSAPGVFVQQADDGV
jgi:hypothetical protein